MIPLGRGLPDHKDSMKAMFMAAIFIEDLEEAAEKYPELVKGNIQANKWIYMYQTYVWPKKVNPPKDYTGLWKKWTKAAELESESNFKNGKRDGLTKFYVDGKLKFENSYKNGVLDGFSKKYFSNGKLRTCRRLKEKVGIGISTEYDKSGALIHMYYWDGVAISVEKSPSTIRTKKITIFSKKEGIDLRPKYAKEIAEFKAELAKWETENK